MRGDYRPDVDGLRAVAVAAVLLFHAFPGFLPGGFTGVDVFFVISGFLITGGILRRERAGTFSVADFYARRIRRIFPALLAVLVGCLAFGWVALLASEYERLGKHAAAGAASVLNLVLVGEAGYFDAASAAKPLLHLWSLGVEEQFYLVWPVALLLALRLRRPLAAVCSLTLASLLSNFFVGDQVAAFYLPLTRFWEIGAGAALAIAVAGGGWSPGPRLRGALAWGGLALVAAGALLSGDVELPVLAALAPVAGALCVVGAGGGAWASRLLASRPAVYVGLISYPLYLWHWPLLSFARITQSGEVSVGARLALLAASFALAALTYRYVEAPLRHSRRRLTVLWLCLAAGAVAAVGVIVWHAEGVRSRLPYEESVAKTARRAARLDPACVERYGVDGQNDYCRMVGGGGQTVFVLGDSIAEGVFQAYGRKLASRGYAAVHLATGGCPFGVSEAAIAESDASPRVAEAARSCRGASARYLAAATSSNLAAVLIAHDAWESKRALFVSGMSETLAQVPPGVRVVWFLRLPKPPKNFRACAERPLSAGAASSDCPYPRDGRDEAAYAAAVTEVLAAFPQVVAVDPTGAFCDGGTCRAMLEGKFLYADPRHLSLIGSRYLAERVPLEAFFGGQRAR